MTDPFLCAPTLNHIRKPSVSDLLRFHMQGQQLNDLVLVYGTSLSRHQTINTARAQKTAFALRSKMLACECESNWDSEGDFELAPFALIGPQELLRVL